MKRASYRDGVDFIAQNDEPDELDPSVMDGMASVVMLASIFGVDVNRVARDVIRLREKINKAQGRVR